jgi:hypothetical protein
MLPPSKPVIDWPDEMLVVYTGYSNNSDLASFVSQDLVDVPTQGSIPRWQTELRQMG